MKTHFLLKAVNELPVYKTPEKILKFIESETTIKNPPYDTKTEIKKH